VVISRISGTLGISTGASSKTSAGHGVPGTGDSRDGVRSGQAEGFSQTLFPQRKGDLQKTAATRKLVLRARTMVLTAALFPLLFQLPHQVATLGESRSYTTQHPAEQHETDFPDSNASVDTVAATPSEPGMAVHRREVSVETDDEGTAVRASHTIGAVAGGRSSSNSSGVSIGDATSVSADNETDNVIPHRGPKRAHPTGRGLEHGSVTASRSGSVTTSRSTPVRSTSSSSNLNRVTFKRCCFN
jgi:hypothetical protein